MLAVALSGLLLVTCPVPVQAQSDQPPQAAVHIVQRGETMFSIAARYGLSIDAIAHTNGIPDPRKIYVGQRLIIPGDRLGLDLDSTLSYVVQAGDALPSIARRYQTTWQTLVRLNNLLSPGAIYVGQVIQIPALSTSANVPISTGMSPGLAMGGGTLYVVRSDDTLFRIALRYDVSPWEIASVSRIGNPALIYQGRELLIPSSESGLLPEPFVFVEIQPLPPVQGATVIVAVHTTEPVELTGSLFGRAVPFAEEEGVYYGLAGVHVYTDPGIYELELTAVRGSGQNIAISADIPVEASRFGYEQISVPASRSSLLAPEVVITERERLEALVYTHTLRRYWSVPFQRPSPGPISSYYGTRRSYNGGPYTSYHSGVDFRAPSGTRVHAPAAGTVILAEHLVMRGNAIVIDHGWGLLTGYWHLSAIEVQTDQQVQQGELIGKVGNTGLSTGAHLHWETWVGGVSVNGAEWLEKSPPWPDQEDLAVGG